jgi:uncharacterized protein (DUF433 family)
MRTCWQDRISIDPEVHHGDPCIKGTRIPVTMIVGSLADGLSFDEIHEAFPQIGKEDIYAALAYAAEVMRHELVYPIG